MFKLSDVSTSIIVIASPIIKYTGKISKKPIIGDFVNVVASPTRNIKQKQLPNIVIIFLFILKLLF